jgi:hypothetical protein
MSVGRRGLLQAAFAAALALSACRAGLPGKIAFAGQNALLQSGTQVNFQEAWVAENIFKVRLFVQNLSQTVMFVDRDGFQLRLPDGRVLGRASGMTTVHKPYSLPPGSGHEVFVDFRDPGNDMRLYTGAALIVGGISYATDPRPRVVGEVPLVPTGAR